jgi:hypothetical protein
MLFFIGGNHFVFQENDIEPANENDQHGKHVVDHHMKKSHSVNENERQEQQNIVYPDSPHQ